MRTVTIVFLLSRRRERTIISIFLMSASYSNPKKVSVCADAQAAPHRSLNRIFESPLFFLRGLIQVFALTGLKTCFVFMFCWKKFISRSFLSYSPFSSPYSFSYYQKVHFRSRNMNMPRLNSSVLMSIMIPSCYTHVPCLQKPSTPGNAAETAWSRCSSLHRLSDQPVVATKLFLTAREYFYFSAFSFRNSKNINVESYRVSTGDVLEDLAVLRLDCTLLFMKASWRAPSPCFKHVRIRQVNFHVSS